MQEKWKWPERSGSGETALRKGPWTKEEDEILVNFVKEKGIVKWTWIGKQTGLARSGKSCRLRWLNHLRPNLKKGSFTKEEENLIVCLHSMHGNKWTRIASKLPGRTDNEIKNFWNTRLKKCQKKQLPIYPQSQTMEEDKSPVFHNDYLNNNDLDQIQTPLHHFSSTLPHSSHFSSHNQFSPTHQPLPHSSPPYLSSLHHSMPASYQSMQAFLSSRPMPPPTCLSSHPLIMPTTCASTPFMSSLDFGPFGHFKRPAGRLPRPLSAPLMSPSPTSQDPFHSSFQLNSSNHSSSLSPPNINKTQTSTVPTFQLNYSTAGPSNSSLQAIPLSVDITWPPVSPNSSFIFKAEPPSIQSHPIAARRHPSNASLRHLNTQSMISLDLLNAQLQEDLATRGCQSSRKQDFLDQNMTRENLLTECMKTKDSSNNVTWKQSLSNEISKAKIPTDEYSKKDVTWAESSKTMDSSGSSLNTEYSSYKSMRRKEFMNIGSHLTEGLLSEGSDFTKCLGREDSLLGESAIIGCSITKNLNEGESEQELREDLLEEGSRKEGLWIESINKYEVVKAASSHEGDFWSKISNRDDLADTSVSQDNNSLTNNSCKESLFDSQKQKGDADLVLDQNNRSFLLESRGPSSKSSYMKISTEEKEATETEDHTDNELSSLLEFFSHGC